MTELTLIIELILSFFLILLNSINKTINWLNKTNFNILSSNKAMTEFDFDTEANNYKFVVDNEWRFAPD